MSGCRVALCVALLAGPLIAAAAQPFEYQWNVRDIVAADGPTAELRTRTKRLVGTVSVAQMRVLYAVKSSLEQVAELTTELLIVDGKKPNAFAGKATDGRNVVGINLAMIDLLGNDVHAAAALLGHEIAHLKLGHGDERARQKSGSAIMRIFGGVALGALGVPAGGLISDITVSAIDTQYSRDNEREADYLGAIWAVEANFEAAGAARLHQALLSRTGTQAMPFLSSHPSGPERINTLNALAKRLSR